MAKDEAGPEVIPLPNPHLEVAVATHPGSKREVNEDSLRVETFAPGAGGGAPSTAAVVSDGIGGNVAGEVAAQIVVDTVIERLARSTGRDPLEEISAAIIVAGRAVAERAEAEPALRGMGATVAVAWVVGDRLYTSTVGDSRIYLLRRRRLHQVSTDHTWVQEAVERGKLEARDARRHPYGHVLRRHLGAQEDASPDLRLRLSAGESNARARSHQGLRLSPGDTVLLCTDGLSDLVPLRNLEGLIKGEDLSESVAALTEAALARGGNDNVTAVALRVPRRDGRSPLLAARMGNLIRRLLDRS